RLSVEAVIMSDGKVAQLKLPLTGEVELTGRVTLRDGGPAKIQVRAVWVSDDGSSRLETATTTAADGIYSMRSPFGQCETIIYPDGDKEIRIDRTGLPPIKKETRDYQLSY